VERTIQTMVTGLSLTDLIRQVASLHCLAVILPFLN
jgi:hypothetical protein